MQLQSCTTDHRVTAMILLNKYEILRLKHVTSTPVYQQKNQHLMCETSNKKTVNGK